MISIDPGKRAVGWAAWAGGLFACGYSEGTTPYAIWIPGSDAFSDHDLAVVELMRHSRDRSGSVANDLIDVQAFGSAVGGLNARQVEHVTAKMWKGDVPKTIMERRILKALMEEELAIVEAAKVAKSKRHNMIDAIGIGLWKLGRL